MRSRLALCLESQEGLKQHLHLLYPNRHQKRHRVESQEGLKLHRPLQRDGEGEGAVESQEGLKLHVAARAVHYLAVHHVESQEGLKRLCEHAWLKIVP